MANWAAFGCFIILANNCMPCGALPPKDNYILYAIFSIERHMQFLNENKNNYVCFVLEIPIVFGLVLPPCVLKIINN